MATHTVSQQQSATRTVKIWISDIIEADYVRRGVFPVIRREGAHRVNCAQREYSVTRAEATAIYEDAVEMSLECRGTSGKGVTIAYTATRSRLVEFRKEEAAPPARMAALDAVRISSVLDLMSEQQSCGAVLPAGSRILYFRDDEEYGRPGITMEGFRYFKVQYENGSRIDPDGSRFEFRPGYCIKLEDSESPFFVPPHALTLDDCKPSYLKLVHSA